MRYSFGALLILMVNHFAHIFSMQVSIDVQILNRCINVMRARISKLSAVSSYLRQRSCKPAGRSQE